jgi:hypothetical protein
MGWKGELERRRPRKGAKAEFPVYYFTLCEFRVGSTILLVRTNITPKDCCE